MKPRPYIILTPSYCVSGGVRVMHALCHELNMLGFDARLLLTSNLSGDGPLVNPNWHTPTINESIDDWPRINEESIVISADGILGNPFGAKRIVRYILGLEGAPGAPEEFKVYFSRSFIVNRTGSAHTLFYLAADLALFNDNGAGERTQDMLWLGKCAQYCTEPPPGAVHITYQWPAARHELAEQLRRTRYLYSYDAVSLTNVEAVLCGAAVIVRHMSYNGRPWGRADLEAFELGAGGFAFDETPAELERALRSRGELMERARAAQMSYRQRLLNFVDDTQYYFRNT